MEDKEVLEILQNINRWIEDLKSFDGEFEDLFDEVIRMQENAIDPYIEMLGGEIE